MTNPFKQAKEKLDAEKEPAAKPKVERRQAPAQTKQDLSYLKEAATAPRVKQRPAVVGYGEEQVVEVVQEVQVQEVVTENQPPIQPVTVAPIAVRETAEVPAYFQAEWQNFDELEKASPLVALARLKRSPVFVTTSLWHNGSVRALLKQAGFGLDRSHQMTKKDSSGKGLITGVYTHNGLEILTNYRPEVDTEYKYLYMLEVLREDPGSVWPFEVKTHD